jgi:hypothetical protein
LLDQFLNQTFSNAKPTGYVSRLTFFLLSALSLFLSGGRGNRISLVLAIRYSNYPLYPITSESAVVIFDPCRNLFVTLKLAGFLTNFCRDFCYYFGGNYSVLPVEVRSFNNDDRPPSLYCFNHLCTVIICTPKSSATWVILWLDSDFTAI